MYGYANDEKSSSSSMVFGLNQKVTMTKFEFNPNGGKDGAAQECLDISFEFNGGTVKNWRQFPVTQAIDKNGNKVTDPRSNEMRAAFNEFNAKISQLMKCFITEDELKQGLMGVSNFKSYCTALSNLLPKDYSSINLDVFCQYQWTSKSDNGTKYVEIPSNVKQGKVFVAAEEGSYEPITIDSKAMTFTFRGTDYPVTNGGVKKFNLTIGDATITVDSNKGLVYVKEDNGTFVLHPITRTDWFMTSNFAKATDGAEPIQSSWD